jgi:hypothetical protein
MTPREELAALRRMAELEAKAAGQSMGAAPGEIPGPRAPMSLVDQIPGSSVRAPAPTGSFAQPRVAGPRMTGTVVDQIPGYGGPVPAATSQTPRTGRELYQTIRPVLAPTVEALGSVGGAALGTTLGPVGTVGGAGLGYGMAKEALKLGDIYFGGMTPDQAQTQPIRNILEGATFEAGGRAIGPALGYVGGKIADLRAIPQQRAAKLAKEAVGSDLKAVVNALRETPSSVGVGQATAKFQNPAFQALVKDSLEATPEGAQYLNKLGTMTEDQAVNELAKLVGGRTSTEVRDTLAAAKNAARAITTPMRDTALARGNLGKEVARLETMSAELGEQAAAKVQEVRRLIDLGDHAAAAARLKTITAGLPASSRLAPAKSQAGFSDEFASKFFYPGKLAQMSDEWASQAATASLDLGQGARFSQAAADALRKSGIQPLRGDALISNIQNIGNKPEFAGNDLLLGALRNVSDDVAKWTNSGGVIDLVALDAIRKNSVNAVIQQLRPGMDAASQRNAAAGVLSRIKPVIDDAIETAGGTGYRDYLKKHAELSQKIAEKELTGEALKLYKNNKDAFVRLVQNESDDVVEKILGPGKYNIAVELADDTMSVLRKQASDHMLRVASAKQATEGQKALANLVAQNTSMLRLPSFVNAWAAAGNKTIGELEKRLGQKTMKTLSDAMRSPESAANLLDSLPPSERNRVIQFLNNPGELKQRLVAPTIRGATNALTGESENQNALNR